MFTATALADQLAAVDRQIVAIRLKAEEKKQLEEERYANVCAKRDECAAGHQKKVDELVTEYSQQLEGTVSQADREVAAIEDSRVRAVQQSADAQTRAAALNAQARELERDIRAMCARIDAQEADYDRQCHEVQQEADYHVSSLLQEASSTILDTSMHAAELQDRALQSIAHMHEEARSSVCGAEDLAKRRSRFDELVIRISRRHSQDLTPDQLVQAKAELLQAWLDDWVANASRATPETPSYLTDILSPGASQEQWRMRPERSVDREMNAATARKQSLSGLDAHSAEWGEFRPTTA